MGLCPGQAGAGGPRPLLGSGAVQISGRGAKRSLAATGRAAEIGRKQTGRFGTNSGEKRTFVDRTGG